jgi:hypothetical protein
LPRICHIQTLDEPIAEAITAHKRPTLTRNHLTRLSAFPVVS